ncbi:MAG TPA: hypothetical protein ENH23_00225, partial [candidate division Zixibacteria bacterium]|nr:hypothetical protein [candidate division Zixibacteria bacterium]
HLVFIQPRKSTKFIKDDSTGGDCSSIGNWDNATKTCILTTDVNETIQIDDDNITLDGNNHTLTGTNTGSGVYLYQKTGISIKNLDVKNFTTGINIFYSSNNIAINNVYGILSQFSSNGVLTNNTMNSNTYNFGVIGTQDSHFSTNTIDTSNTVDGKPIYYIKNAIGVVYDNSLNIGAFYCINCENVTIKNLTFEKNVHGIYFWNTNDSKIENVNVTSNSIGLHLFFSDNNILANNNMTLNKISGIYLNSSNNNQIYNNNFIDNKTQAFVYSSTSNIFDNGYPDGGNYWSDYTGVDEFSGSNQNQPGSDGIGDTPYTFSGDQDRYPFMEEKGWLEKTLSEKAADLAKELIYQPYLWGGKGWDYNQGLFVSADTVKTGYNFYNASIKSVDFGAGVDCSGLIMWAYDRSFDPNKPRFDNFVKAEGADEQYRYNTATITESELKPGDVMFFDNVPKDGFIDHVAMYVGETDGYDVVSAADPARGIVPDLKDNLKQLSGFVAFKQVVSTSPPSILVSAHSPVDLTVTDPDGFTITSTTTISSDLEYLRQIPGVLYYSEVEKETDGKPIDQVYSYITKTGDYLINVIPEPDALPTDTFSLSFTANMATTTILAENIPISNIPTQPYTIRSSEGKFEKIIPAKIKIKPETLNLSSKGVSTVFLQIEPGFGASVKDIDTATIRLAQARPIKTFFERKKVINSPRTKKKHKEQKDDKYKGGKDNEALTLVAKFRVRDLVDISIGKEVELTLTGSLFDGTKVEGSDTVRVIHKHKHHEHE